MNNFIYHAPTEMIFGRNVEAQIGQTASKYGHKTLLVFGKGSVVKSGLLSRLEQSLTESGIAYEEFGGAQPNPTLEHAEDGVKKALGFGADMIIGVGGGSAIDTAKAIAHGTANSDQALWDLWTKKAPLNQSLPVGAVLTIPAAGSEMSDSAVLTNTAIGKKAGINTTFNRCKFAIINPDWEFVEVYTDEGISATNTRKREGFNRMIADALSGKIDLIVTKSVSRFARNTVDSLIAVRKLKEHGTEVYFEKEGIYTFDSKGELLITIMSSLAQEESRSISENVTWGQRKRFADGKISLPYKAFLGYRKGENGLPEIVPEEAEIVRVIYRMFISGRTVNYIAKHLTQQGIPTPRGKQKWQSSTVESILTNEKYKGAALLQKRFTVDFLNKKMKVNEGEVPQYYVEHSHPAIIEPDEWELVQQEMAYRKSLGKHRNSLSPFSFRIICGDCGAYYGAKLWHSTSKYRRTVWQCNDKFSGEQKCTTPHLYEDDIKRLFMAVIDELYSDRQELIATCKLAIAELTDTATLDAELAELSEDMDVLAGRIERLISENALTAQDQDDFNSRYDALAEKYNALKTQYEKKQSLRDDRARKRTSLEAFLLEIDSAALPLEYSDRLWLSHIGHATVYGDGRIVFTFRNGTEIMEKL